MASTNVNIANAAAAIVTASVATSVVASTNVTITNAAAAIVTAGVATSVLV